MYVSEIVEKNSHARIHPRVVFTRIHVRFSVTYLSNLRLQPWKETRYHAAPPPPSVCKEKKIHTEEKKHVSDTSRPVCPS